MIGQTVKPCEICGAEFRRNPSYSASQWGAARFCSKECAGRNRAALYTNSRGRLFDKFNARFVKGGGCWEWQGTIDGYGYGVIDYAGKRYRAHVLALEYDGRPVPAGMIARHHCDNRKCVRPDHLEPGTAKDNAHDAMARGRNTRGERVGIAKLTEEMVREIRSLPPMPYTELARMYGVSRPTVTRVLHGKTWGHVK